MRELMPLTEGNTKQKDRKIQYNQYVSRMMRRQQLAVKLPPGIRKITFKTSDL